MELFQMRYEALYETYIDGLRQGCFDSLVGAAEYVARQPAPMFYITARSASLLIALIEQRVSLTMYRLNQRRKIWTIYHLYRQWRAEHPDSTLSRERVLELIVDEPAPSFFLTEECIRKNLQKMAPVIQDRAIRRLVR